MKFLLLFLTALSASGANRYVRSGATGAANGTSWTDAYTALPSTLVRGDTYYVATGNYPSVKIQSAWGGHGVTTTVKKATTGDHGTETGWVASYGVGQAVFASMVQIASSWIVFDGGYRNETNWFDINAYGFRINHNFSWTHLWLATGLGGANGWMTNVTVKYLGISAQVGVLPPEGLGYRPYAIDTATNDNDVNNTGLLLHRCFVLGSNNPYFVRQTSGVTIEYCASDKVSGSGAFHSEQINLKPIYYGTAIIRYNHLRNFCNGASGHPADGGTAPIVIQDMGTRGDGGGCQVYGNLIENFYCGDGGIGAGWQNNNLKIYNNTFVNGYTTGSAIIHGPTGTVKVNNVVVSTYTTSGNESHNNVFIRCTNLAGANLPIVDGQMTSVNNSQLYSTNFVVSSSSPGGNYRLAQATAAGTTNLGAQFNYDMDGVQRGKDGNFDRGAFEYNVIGPEGGVRPTITSGNASGTNGIGPMFYQITATENPTYYWETNLSATGLTLTNSNGSIGGTPTTGTNQVGLFCSNQFGFTNSIVTFSIETEPQGVFWINWTNSPYTEILTNTIKNFSILVSNAGPAGTTLSGNMTNCTVPWSIVSSSNYSLAAGATKYIILRYSPTTVGVHTGSVAFTHGRTNELFGAAYPVCTTNWDLVNSLLIPPMGSNENNYISQDYTNIYGAEDGGRAVFAHNSTSNGVIYFWTETICTNTAENNFYLTLNDAVPHITYDLWDVWPLTTNWAGSYANRRGNGNAVYQQYKTNAFTVTNGMNKITVTGADGNAKLRSFHIMTVLPDAPAPPAPPTLWLVTTNLTVLGNVTP